MLVANLKRIYFRQQFEPGLLGLLVNPFYFARKGIYDTMRQMKGYVKGRTLDVGCGQKPYQHLFECADYCGLEIEPRPGEDRKPADFFYDGKTFPFADGVFDTVISSQVLEHVFTPEDFLAQVRRVLKPAGHFLLTVPFIWDEHEQPYDFARYSSFGLAYLLQTNGFRIVEHRKTMADARVIFQLLNAFIYKKTVCRYKIVNIFTALVLMAPFNILGQLLHFILPGNADLYLDNIVVAQRAGGGLVKGLVTHA